MFRIQEEVSGSMFNKFNIRILNIFLTSSLKSHYQFGSIVHLNLIVFLFSPLVSSSFFFCFYDCTLWLRIQTVCFFFFFFFFVILDRIFHLIVLSDLISNALHVRDRHTCIQYIFYSTTWLSLFRTMSPFYQCSNATELNTFSFQLQ